MIASVDGGYFGDRRTREAMVDKRKWALNVAMAGGWSGGGGVKFRYAINEAPRERKLRSST